MADVPADRSRRSRALDRTHPMSLRLLIHLLFAALLAVGAVRLLRASAPVTSAARAEAIVELSTTVPPAQTGTFPTTWNSGVNCPNEPAWQAHAYNPDTYIIRQSKCVIFEAPFLYLLFGEDEAILMDTGAEPNVAVYRIVKRIVDNWLLQNGKTSIPLTVAHTHSHFDHIQGDAQFVGKPDIAQVVGLSINDVVNFWGFQNYPVDMPVIDLGNRVITVMGTPGHSPESVTLYDHNTQLLLTGDIVYPGHLFIFSPNHWQDFVDSLARLTAFAAANPVEWVVGCHIEYSDTPGMPFAYGTPAHPNEHVLQFPPKILEDVYRAALDMGSTPECKIFDEFVIHPVYLCGIGWNG